VTLIAAVSYAWEQKRPPLTRPHRLIVPGGLALVVIAVIGLVWQRRAWHAPAGTGFAELMWVTPGLWPPAAAAAAFVAMAWVIRQRALSRREAGRRVMLAGLLWLIVYDAAFVLGYVGWREAIVIASALPMAYASVRLARWWSNLAALAQRPRFRRAPVR
jgi:hypothetical protein